jgi:hypothetical protein
MFLEKILHIKANNNGTKEQKWHNTEKISGR